MAFKPAKAIREKVRVKQINAAQELLSQYQDSLSPKQREELSKLVTQQFNLAKNLAFDASLLENQGKLEEAKQHLERVGEIAVDYPDLQAEIARLDESIHLSRYVRKRSERLRDNLSDEGTKKKKRIALILAGLLACIILPAVLFLSKNEPPLAPQSNDEKSIRPVKQGSTASETLITEPTPSVEADQPRGKTPEPAKQHLPQHQPATTEKAQPAGQQKPPQQPVSAEKAPPDRTDRPQDTAIKPAEQQPAPQQPVTTEKADPAEAGQPRKQGIAVTDSQGMASTVTAPETQPAREEDLPATVSVAALEERVEIPTSALPPAESLPQDQSAVIGQTTTSVPLSTGPYGDDRTYTVQAGDSLSLIAYQLFCNEQERTKLFLINQDQMEHPDVLAIGQKLRLTSPNIEIINLCRDPGEQLLPAN